MTLEEYAVERIKELESKKVELEAALKSKENDYKTANSTIRRIREENEFMKELIGYLGIRDSSTSLNRGGTIYMYLHDPWGKTSDLEDEEDIKRRKWFDFCKEVIISYKESHFPPEEEDKERGDEDGD